MSEEDKDSKTQEASEQKLRKAKEKGDVPISKEIGHMAIYGGMLVILSAILPNWAEHLSGDLSGFFDMAKVADVGTGAAGLADLGNLVLGPFLTALKFLAACLGTLYLLVLVAGFGQGPFVVAGDRIMPKLNKISPLKGVTRILGAQNLVEFLKSFVKLGLLGFAAMWAVTGLLQGILPGSAVYPEAQPGLFQGGAVLILFWIIAMMIPVAIADFVWKRISYLRKQRMSMKEIKDEHKATEGDPMMKAKRDQIRRRRIRMNVMKVVPDATLIVTNPTHYAVAIRFQRGVDQAPVCLAKGTDLIARQIRMIAFEHEIPVIESRALARALHASAEIDQEIPEIHWEAIAELVAYVFDLKAKIRRKAPENANLRHIWDEERQ